MDRRSFGNTNLPFPLADNGEKTRLAFWREHAEPIPTELLEITGWIDERPDREVLVQSGGRVDTRLARERPPNVLFRIPRDPAGKKEWETWLFYLRLEQSRRRTVDQHVRTAEDLAKGAATQQQLRWDQLFEVVETSRDAGRRARIAMRAGNRELLFNTLQELRAGVERARAVASSWRLARRHCEDANRALSNFGSHQGRMVYPGLFARINSFLDLQSLTVASLASDEFRKRTRRPQVQLPPPMEEEPTIESG